MPAITIQTRRRMPRALVAGIALTASLGTLLLCTVPGADAPAAPADAPVPLSGRLPDALLAVKPDAVAATIASDVTPTPKPSRSLRAAPRASAPAPIPYRFVGSMTVEGETALVFFGRGRTVTLRAPGPLDDEFAVDAILEHQVLLRHLPTGRGQFIELTPRQATTEMPASPDTYPQD